MRMYKYMCVLCIYSDILKIKNDILLGEVDKVILQSWEAHFDERLQPFVEANKIDERSDGGRREKLSPGKIRYSIVLSRKRCIVGNQDHKQC